LQGVFPASLLKGFLHIVGRSIEAVGGTKPFYALVGPLVVVIADPVIESLGGVGKGSKVGVLQKFGPYGFPEPLDFAQGHGVMRGGANVRYALSLQHLLEPGLPTPGRKLAAVVREYLPWCSPLAYSTLDHFEYSL
jgi:hypothetical protein